MTKAEETKNFINEPSNRYCCADCPLNNGMEHDNVLPCGQYHCWCDAVEESRG